MPEIKYGVSEGIRTPDPQSHSLAKEGLVVFWYVLKCFVLLWLQVITEGVANPLFWPILIIEFTISSHSAGKAEYIFSASFILLYMFYMHVPIVCLVSIEHGANIPENT